MGYQSVNAPPVESCYCCCGAVAAVEEEEVAVKRFHQAEVAVATWSRGVEGRMAVLPQKEAAVAWQLWVKFHMELACCYCDEEEEAGAGDVELVACCCCCCCGDGEAVDCLMDSYCYYCKTKVLPWVACCVVVQVVLHVAYYYYYDADAETTAFVLPAAAAEQIPGAPRRVCPSCCSCSR